MYPQDDDEDDETPKEQCLPESIRTPLHEQLVQPRILDLNPRPTPIRRIDSSKEARGIEKKGNTPIIRNETPSQGAGTNAIPRSSSNALGSISSPPQRCITINDRIETVAQRLSDMGLLSIKERQSSIGMNASMGNETMTDQPPCAPANSLDGQPFQYFVSLMHSMKMDIMTSPESTQTGSARPTTLNALLATFENILDETSHLSQECMYYQKQLQHMQSQADPVSHVNTDDCHSHPRESFAEITEDGLSEQDAISTISNIDSKQFLLQFNFIREENKRLKTLLRDMGCASLLGGGEEEMEDTSNLLKGGSAGWYQCHTLEHQIQTLQGLNGELGRENEFLRQKLELFRGGISTSADINSLSAQEELRTNIQRQETEFNVIIANKDMECARIQQFVKDLQREREHLHTLHESAKMALARSEQEVTSLNLQANSLSSENSRLHAEVISLRERANAESCKALEYEKQLNAYSAAKNEALINLGKITDERTKLELELGQMKNDLIHRNQELRSTQDENKSLLEKNKYMETDIQSHMSSIRVLEEERQQNGQKIESLRNALAAAEGENRQINQELNSVRINGNFASNKTLELQQIAAKAQFDVAAFRKTVTELEAEREPLRELLNSKQSKINELEERIVSHRSNEAVASEQIRKLVREKAQIGTKLNEANARLQNNVEPSNRIFTSKQKYNKSHSDAVQKSCHEKNQNETEESVRQLELVSPPGSDSIVSNGIDKENRHPPATKQETMNDTLSSLSRNRHNEQSVDFDSSSLSHEPLSLLDYLSPEESTRA